VVRALRFRAAPIKRADTHQSTEKLPSESALAFLLNKLFLLVPPAGVSIVRKIP
jgi:hypothetical protein